MIRPRDPKELAAAVSIDSGLKGYRKKVMAAVVKTCSPSDDALRDLNDTLKAILPESLSLLDSVRDDSGAELTDDALLNGITFSQLTRIAREAKIIGKDDETVFGEINGYRNAFAHFRAETYGRCVRLLQVLANARRAFEDKS